MPQTALIAFNSDKPGDPGSRLPLIIAFSLRYRESCRHINSICIFVETIKTLTTMEKRDLSPMEIAALIATAKKVIEVNPAWIADGVMKLLVSAADQFDINENKINPVTMEKLKAQIK